MQGSDVYDHRYHGKPELSNNCEDASGNVGYSYKSRDKWDYGQMKGPVSQSTSVFTS